MEGSPLGFIFLVYLYFLEILHPVNDPRRMGLSEHVENVDPPGTTESLEEYLSPEKVRKVTGRCVFVVVVLVVPTFVPGCT